MTWGEVFEMLFVIESIRYTFKHSPTLGGDGKGKYRIRQGADK
jgi:hypothetical protein